MTVVPVENLGRRMPEAGRIRLGVKSERGAPRSIDTLRFTSDNEAAIRELATLYGGEARVWNPRGARTEWEVITTVKSVPVILPPDPLGGTPIYELWSGGGLVRRCDGATCTVARKTPDGAEQAEVPCICTDQGRMDCTVTTRLSVILPEIHFAGTWRLETHGWFAAKELPGMVETILVLQNTGFARAILALERRTQTNAGQTRNFVVPVLRSAHTVEEIVSGAASLGAIASPEAAKPLALPPPPVIETFDDDDVAEAEVVEEPDEPAPDTRYLRLVIALRDRGMTDDDRHAIARTVSEGRTDSTKDLEPSEIQRVMTMLERLDRGEVIYTGITDGRAVFHRTQEAR